MAIGEFRIPRILLSMFYLLLLSVFVHVEAHSSTSYGIDTPSPDDVSNFQPSLAVVIAILAIMFSLTFILLVYAKFCHRSASINHHRQNHESWIQGRTFSGIDKTVIESLPFFRFSLLKGSREGLECAVCLSKFEDVEILRLLPKCKHAFHINCVDQWLEKHSSCPLCRHRVSADDLAFLTYSNSLRFLWNNQPELREDSNMELFVEREDDQERGSSSRFSIGSSFRMFNKAKTEEELPIQENSGSDENGLHKFNHRIVVSDVVLKNRWSSVSSSDLMFLNSEMLNTASSDRFASVNGKLPAERTVEDGETVRIKEETEGKRESFPFSGLPNTPSESGQNPSQTSRYLSPKEKRSMSEIIVHPRFREFSSKNSIRESDLLPENDRKEERLRELWMPIARRTVQWFANREERNQQPDQKPSRDSLNV